VIPAKTKERISSRQFHCLLFFVGFSIQLFADDSDFPEAVKHLNQMSLAMSQMTYQGTFVYVQGSLVETMRITHVVDENGIHERLVAQTGRQRELRRDAEGVRWIARDQQAVVSDPSVNRGFFPVVTSDAIENAADFYTISLGGLEPLAGRLGRKLSIIPLDKYRYGYSLWLEEPSGFLLKWELFQDSARPLARLMFTDIRIGNEVDRSELRSNDSMDGFQTQASDLPQKPTITQSKPRWIPEKPPPGFRLTSHRREDSQSAVMFQHLVYSDGIATVSVYVEPFSETDGSGTGASSLGTTNAHSRLLDDYLITVMGDVPAATVREMAMSVTKQSP